MKLETILARLEEINDEMFEVQQKQKEILKLQTQYESEFEDLQHNLHCLIGNIEDVLGIE